MAFITFNNDKLKQLASGERQSLNTMIAILEQNAEQMAQTAEQNAGIITSLTNVIQTLIKIEAADIELIRDENNRPIGSRKILEGI